MLLAELPLWAVYWRYAQDRKADLLKPALPLLLQKLLSLEAESLATIDLNKLQLAILCSLTVATEAESEQVIRHFLHILSIALTSQALEKRVEAASFLSKLSTTYLLSQPVFTQLFTQFVPEFRLVNYLTMDLHHALLIRAQPFLYFCAKNSLVTKEVLSVLWEAAVQSHESTRAAAVSLLAGMAGHMREAEADYLTELLVRTDPADIDAAFLDLLRVCIEGLRDNLASKKELAEVTLAKLEEVGDVGRAKMTTLACILLLPTFFETAQATFQRHLSLLSTSTESIEFIYFFLQLLNTKKIPLRRFISPDNAFVDICIDAIANSPVNTPQLLQCINEASYFDPRSEVYFSRQQQLGLWGLFCSRDPRPWFSFLRTCSAPWMKSDHARDTLQEMDQLSRATKAMLKHITYEDFQGLAHAVLACNEELDMQQKVVGIDLVTAAIVLMEEKTRLMAATDLIQSFTQAIACNECARKSLNCLISLLSDAEAVPGSASLLLAFLSHEEAYSTRLFHEEDLELTVAHILATHSEVSKHFWAKGRPEDYVRNEVQSLAINSNVPYYCVGVNEKEGWPEFYSNNFQTLKLSGLIEEKHALKIVELLKTHKNWSESILIWKTLIQLMPKPGFFNAIFKHLGTYFQSNHFSDRMVWLLSVPYQRQRHDTASRSTQLSESVLTLFDNLNIDQPPEYVLNHYSYQFVVYCELLVKNMDELFWKRKLKMSPGNVQKVLNFVVLISHYFVMPNMDHSLPITIFPATLTLLQSLGEAMSVHFTSLKTLMANCLVHCQSLQFRIVSCCWLAYIAKLSFALLSMILQELIPLLEYVIEEEHPAFQGFQLLSGLVESCEIDWTEGLMQFLEKVIDYTVDEERFWRKEEAHREALLTTLHSLWKYMTVPQKQRVIGAVRKWLFEFQDSHREKIKPESSTAQAALALLAIPGTQLSTEDAEILHETVSFLNHFHTNMAWRKPHKAKWTLRCEPHPTKPYIGIKNLGSTCYMSSLFQQLYHIPSFCGTVLAIETEGRTELITAFVNLFVELKYKSHKAVSPGTVVTTLGDICADVKEQKDIDEFWRNFMGKLSQELTESELNDLLRFHFQGNQLFRLKCKSCGYTRENQEDFYSLSLQVSGKSCLSDSLNAFIKGEVMSGVNCDNCRSPQATEKLPGLITLPNVLLLNLHRFDYSYELAARRKINDYFEFPNELNMRPFALPNSHFSEAYYVYQLRGVVVHSGTAESGHYFSLVKLGTKWVKFDDEIVSEVTSVEKEAFGSRDGQDSKNAYILLYERPTLLLSDGISPYEVQRTQSLSESVQHKAREMQGKLQHYWQKQQIMSWKYSQFAGSLMLKTSLTPSILKFVISYFLTIHVRVEIWTQSPTFLNMLLQTIQSNSAISIWLLEVLSCPGVLDEFLLTCPIVATQKAVVLLLRAALAIAPEAAAERCLVRFIYRLLLLSAPRSKSASAFFEAFYYILQRVKDYALSIKLPDLFVSKVFLAYQYDPNDYLRFPLFIESGYLGHQGSELQRPAQSSEFTNRLGFHLYILNLLFSPGTLELACTAVKEELASRKDCFSTYFERRNFCNLVKAILSLKPEMEETLLRPWVRSLRLHGEEQVRGFIDLLITLASLTSGKVLSTVFSGLAKGVFSLQIGPSMTKLWANALYSLLLKFPVSPAWASLDIIFQSWLDSSEGDTWETLQCLLSRETTRPDPSPQLYDSYYDRFLPADTLLKLKVEQQTKACQVQLSFGIVHVLKLQGRLKWVAAEEDMRRD